MSTQVIKLLLPKTETIICASLYHIKRARRDESGISDGSNLEFLDSSSGEIHMTH